MLSYALHALKANVSQEEQQQQQEQDRGSLVNRLYLRKPVKMQKKSVCNNDTRLLPKML